MLIYNQVYHDQIQTGVAHGKDDGVMSLVATALRRFENDHDPILNWKTAKFMLLSHLLSLKSENVFEIKCVEPPIAVLMPIENAVKKGWRFKFGIHCQTFNCELDETKFFKWISSSSGVYRRECVICDVNRLGIQCFYDHESDTADEPEYQHNLSLEEMRDVKFMYPRIRLTFKNSIENYHSFVAQFHIWDERPHQFELVHQGFINTNEYDCYVMFESPVYDSSFVFTRIK